MGCGGISTKPEEENGLKNEEVEEAKIILLGDEKVGKTSIAQRILNNVFKERLSTITATLQKGFVKKELIMPNIKKIKMNLWDTGGEERFQVLESNYYKNALAAIFVFDITNEESFENIKFWLNEFKNNNDLEKSLKYLVANKCDYDTNKNGLRKISYEDGLNFSMSNNFRNYYETSAKDDINIQNLFSQIAKEIYEEKNE